MRGIERGRQSEPGQIQVEDRECFGIKSELRFQLVLVDLLLLKSILTDLAFRMYQHFAKFLPLPLLAAMYQQMRSRGLIPNAEMYSNMLLRFKSEPASDFRLQLANDMRLHNVCPT